MNLVKSQFINSEQRLELAQQNIETEKNQRIHYEQKLKEYMSALENERKQVQLLKMVQIESSPENVSQKDEFKTLTELIKDLKNDKEKLMRDLRAKDIYEI